MIKVADGTKARLRRLGNMSALIRGQIEKLLVGPDGRGDGRSKSAPLCGSLSGPTNASTNPDYRKKYGPKSHR